MSYIAKCSNSLKEKRKRNLQDLICVKKLFPTNLFFPQVVTQICYMDIELRYHYQSPDVLLLSIPATHWFPLINIIPCDEKWQDLNRGWLISSKVLADSKLKSNNINIYIFKWSWNVYLIRRDYQFSHPSAVIHHHR